MAPSSSLLSRLASLLYGPHPLSTLASHLHNPSSPTPSVDYRLVRRWANGERPVPDWVWGEMRRLLSERVQEITAALPSRTEELAIMLRKGQESIQSDLTIAPAVLSGDWDEWSEQLARYLVAEG